MSGNGFEVDTGQLDLTRQLFERQRGHLNAINKYISSTCTAPGAFRGLMSLLQGHYSDTLGSAQQGMTSGVSIAEHCASTISQTRDTYLRSDRRAYERFAAAQKAAGHAVAPYRPPATAGTLGPAAKGLLTPGCETYKAVPSVWDRIAQTAGGVVKGGVSATVGRNDPANREPNPDWFDRGRAGFHNWRVRRNEEGQDPASGYRTPEDYSHNTRMQQRFDQGYYSGSRRAAGALPDDIEYRGAADQDGHITPNRRPGSAWAATELTSGMESAGVLGSAVTSFFVENDKGNIEPDIAGMRDAIKGVNEGATALRDATTTRQEMVDLVEGPANTGSRDWATDKQTGGSW
ncbi:MAG: hypothetical protein ACRCYX_14355 [Dermatophilaceae bacterium]